MNFPVREYDILQSETARYLIIDFMGEGGFGKVAKCLNLTTNEVVAIKILKDNNDQHVKHEMDTLEALGSLDPDKTNIVRYIESFTHLKIHCMVFEMLDMSVWELINKSNEKRKMIRLNEIRPIIHQLMITFDALARQGIMHTDVKSDNIMLVDHLHQPFKVKLIDFGLAIPESQAELGLMLQHHAFRAPEVYLGAPLSAAVDVWGMGCVMAHMYFGGLIFPYDCPFNWMRNVLLLLGEPDMLTLSLGKYTDKYFKRDIMNPRWTLKTPYEYQAATGSKPDRSMSLLHEFEDLEDAVLSLQLSDDPVERRDRQEFLSLLKSCLTLSPYERITPRQALSHNFLTMAHMADVKDTSVYAETALQLMTVAIQSDVDESDNFSHDSVTEGTAASNSNNTPAADVPKPPAGGTNELTGDTNSDHGGLIDQDSSTERSSGSCCEAEDLSDDKSRDLISTDHPSLPDHGSEDLEPATPHSSHRDLSVFDFMGEGGFGKVAKCLNLTTNEVVAIKILKDNNDQHVKHEMDTLEALGSLDPNKTNIVRYIASFRHLKIYCMVFEMLDMSVWELINKSNEKRKMIRLNEIRHIIHQLMITFDALGRQGIMHTDVKSENIMLVDHLRQPFKVRLIDFGLAIPESQAELGLMLQHHAFRAPEVYLGAPLSAAIDMWGMGCVMAHMYFGGLIFPYDCPFNWMRNVLLLGEPDMLTLSLGKYTDKYFKRDIMNPRWTLKTPYEYQAATGSKPDRSISLLHEFEDLEDAVLSLQLSDNPVERRDEQEFLSLLKSCLTLSPYKRITPRQALSHNFLTMAHMADVKDTSVYAETTLQLMTLAVQSDMDDSNDFSHDCVTEETAASDSNNTPAADVPNPPAAGTEITGDTNSDHGGLIDQDSSTERSSGSCCDTEDLSDDKSRDLISTGHPSILDHGSEDLEPATSHSSHRDLSTHMSNTYSPAPSACIIYASPDVDPNDGAASSCPSSDAAADITTEPNGVQKNPFRRLCIFMGSMKKRVHSMFSKRKKKYYVN